MTKESTGSFTTAGSLEGVCCCSLTTPQCLWPLWDALSSGWWTQWSGPACLHTTLCQCSTPSTDICTGGRERERSARVLTLSHSDSMDITTLWQKQRRHRGLKLIETRAVNLRKLNEGWNQKTKPYWHIFLLFISFWSSNSIWILCFMSLIVLLSGKALPRSLQCISG